MTVQPEIAPSPSLAPSLSEAPSLSVAPSLAEVDAVVDGLLAEVGGLSGAQASQRLAQVSRSAAKLSAYRVALVAKVQSSQVWREKDPNATPVSFLREELVVDHHEAKADLRAAESCERFPELAQACRDGRVARDKMDLILRVGLRNRQRERALPRFMNIFIDLAASAPTSQLRKALELWADQIDPVTTARDEDDAHYRRELHVVQLADGVKLDGFFGKTQGMQVMAALNGALAKQWRDQQRGKGSGGQGEGEGEGEGGAGGGEVPVAERVAGSTARQRADAFIDAIIKPVLAHKLLPTAGGAPATVCVTVPLTRLQHPEQRVAAGQVAASMGEGTLRLGSASIRATNGPGEALISALAAEELSCDANVQRILMSPAGKPLDIGRKTRVIPEQIRTALILRDGGCIYPNCDKPPAWTHAHHIQHWSRGGPTSLTNLALLCSLHHHKIHADHIPITIDADGTPHIHLDHHFRQQN